MILPYIIYNLHATEESVSLEHYLSISPLANSILNLFFSYTASVCRQANSGQKHWVLVTLGKLWNIQMEKVARGTCQEFKRED